MKALQCEMCGSQDMLKQDGYFVCQHCGTKYSVEEAKKMMVEGTVEVQGTVKVDNSDTIKNYLEMVKLAVESEDVNTADTYITKILELDTNNYEAWFYRAKITGWGSSIANDKTKTAVVAAKKAISLAPDENKEEVAEELMNWITAQNLALVNIAKTISSDYTILNRLMLQWIDIVNEIPNLSADAIKKEIELCKNLCEQSKSAFGPIDRAIYATYFAFNNNEPYYITFAKKLAPKIKESDSSYEIPEKKGGCYVATAVYGSYDCPEVWTLRRFRDYTLAESVFGRLFIRMYYAVSPTLVKWFGKTEWFKNLWKPTLDKMVAKLNAEGVEDTPYEDKNW